MRKALIVFGVLVLISLLTMVVWQRHRLAIWAISTGAPPALLPASDEGLGVEWHGDYFTVEEISADTYAIGEPRYHQQNYSYLIVGETRALLFDAGPGVHDIRAIAESLTDIPITFLPSHFHFDHIGNGITFSDVAVVDLPYLRERAVDNQLKLTWEEHLGSAEGFDIPTLQVNEWLAPGASLDLGGRSLQIIYTPGHTEDSISLLDAANAMLFSGDFIYPGPLIAFLPNSSLPAYLEASDRVIDLADERIQLFGAHRISPPGAPRLKIRDLHDLRRTLARIKTGEQTGEGVYPVIYLVNEQMELWAEPRWLQGW